MGGEKTCCYHCLKLYYCERRCPNNYSSCQYCAWHVDSYLNDECPDYEN
jgi:hypothetical protein